MYQFGGQNKSMQMNYGPGGQGTRAPVRSQMPQPGWNADPMFGVQKPTTTDLGGHKQIGGYSPVLRRHGMAAYGQTVSDADRQAATVRRQDESARLGQMGRNRQQMSQNMPTDPSARAGRMWDIQNMERQMGGPSSTPLGRDAYVQQTQEESRQRAAMEAAERARVDWQASMLRSGGLSDGAARWLMSGAAGTPSEDIFGAVTGMASDGYLGGSYQDSLQRLQEFNAAPGGYGVNAKPNTPASWWSVNMPTFRATDVMNRALARRPGFSGSLWG